MRSRLSMRSARRPFFSRISKYGPTHCSSSHLVPRWGPRMTLGTQPRNPRRERGFIRRSRMSEFHRLDGIFAVIQNRAEPQPICGGGPAASRRAGKSAQRPCGSDMLEKKGIKHGKRIRRIATRFKFGNMVSASRAQPKVSIRPEIFFNGNPKLSDTGTPSRSIQG